MEWGDVITGGAAAVLLAFGAGITWLLHWSWFGTHKSKSDGKRKWRRRKKKPDVS